MHNDAPDSDISWTPPNEINHTATNDAQILFSDDTGIDFKNTNEIDGKLRIYDAVTTRNHLLVNWGKFHSSHVKTENIPLIIIKDPPTLQ